MHKIFTALNDLETNEISFYGSIHDLSDTKKNNYCYIKSNENDIENIKVLLRDIMHVFKKNESRIYKRFNYFDEIVLPAIELQKLGFTIVGKNNFSDKEYISLTDYELESIVIKHLLVDVLEETIVCQLKTKNIYKFHLLLSFVNTICEFADRISSFLYNNNVICRLDGMFKSYNPEKGGDNKFKGFYHNFEYEIEDYIRFHHKSEYEIEYNNIQLHEYMYYKNECDLYTQIRKNAKLDNISLAMAELRGIAIPNELTKEEIKLLYELPQLLVETPYNSFNKLFFEMVLYKYYTPSDCEVIVDGATIESRAKTLNGNFKFYDETITNSVDPIGAKKFWNYYPNDMFNTAITKHRLF